MAKENFGEICLVLIIQTTMLSLVLTSMSDQSNNKKPSDLRFAVSACLFYNKQNFYFWTISFGKREWDTEST